MLRIRCFKKFTYLFWLLFVSFVATTVFATSVWASDEYRLSRGDQIQLIIPGVPNGTWTSTVDVDGNVAFPYLGTKQALGITLRELKEQLVLSSVGKSVVFYGSDSSSQEYVLGSADIFVSISSYRAVTVGGAVANPGAVSFEPGLSLREAISRTGGVATALDKLDGLSQVKVLSDREKNQLAHAEAVLEIWLYDCLIKAEVCSLDPAQRSLVEQKLGQNAYVAQKDLIALRLQEDALQVDQLQEQLGIHEQRVSHLKQVLDGYELSALQREQDLKTIEDLFERKLASRDSLSQARQNTLTSNVQALETQSDLFEAEIALKDVGQRLAALRNSQQADHLEALSRAKSALASVEAEQLALARELSVHSAIASEASILAPEVQVIVYRRSKTDVEVLELNQDDLLQPGDAIEVRLIDARQ